MLPSEASTGLTDSHVASLALLANLSSLEFPGHARAFTGSTLGALTALPRLAKLVVTSSKPQCVDYTLALPALAGLRALVRRPSSAATPLHLELGVPDAAFGAALMRAVAGEGLARACIAVREAADSAGISGLALAPGGREKLAGLDLEFRAAPTPEDVAALASCTGVCGAGSGGLELLVGSSVRVAVLLVLFTQLDSASAYCKQYLWWWSFCCQCTHDLLF